MAIRGPLGVFANTPDQLGNNPFSRAFSGASQRDPWAGLRSVGPMSQGTPMGVQQAPSRRFNPLGDPNGALARSGWIGQLVSGAIGGPTRQEFQLEQAGLAQQRGFMAVQERIAGGMPPQRAIMDFMNSEEGRDFFATGSGMTDLANFVKGIAPAVAEPLTLSPGQVTGMQDPNTGAFTPTFEVPVAPPSEIQVFEALSEIGRLDKNEQAALARAQLQKTATGDITDKQMGLDSLLAANKITQETYDLLMADALTVTPILDQAGATKGHAVVNKANGGTYEINSAREPGTVPQVGQPDYVPGVTPGSRKSDLVGQSTGPQFEGLEDPSIIVDSAGPVGWLIERMSGFGTFFPGVVSNTNTRSRKALEIIRADVQQVGEGRMLKQELEDLRGIADQTKFWTSPKTAANTLITLHDRYDNLEETLTEIVNDPNQTNKNKGDAMVDLANIRRAKANLPDQASLQLKLEAIEKEQPFEGALKHSEEERKAIGDITGEDATQQPTAMPDSFGKGRPEHIRRRAWEVFQQGQDQ